MIYSANHLPQPAPRTDSPLLRSASVPAAAAREASASQAAEPVRQPGYTHYAGTRELGPSLTANKGVDAYQAVKENDSKLNPAAANISRFIEAQLQRDVADGADTAALQSRLEAGLEGFLQGFSEAQKLLEGAGLLSEDVASAIEETRTQVLGEIQRMAESLGLEVPELSRAEPELTAQPLETLELAAAAEPQKAMPGEPKTADLLKLDILTSFTERMQIEADTYAHLGKTRAVNAQSYNYGAAAKNSFEFELTTQDGDKVTIRGSSNQSFAQKVSGDGYLTRFDQSQSLGFSVEGDLDAKELSAINDLLTGVNALSGEFFEGDLNRAFEMATRLKFDTSEIAGFALDLKHSSVERVSGVVDRSPPFGEVVQQILEPLLDFTRQVLELEQSALAAGIKQTDFIELAVKILDTNEASSGFNKPAFVRDFLTPSSRALG